MQILLLLSITNYYFITIVYFPLKIEILYASKVKTLESFIIFVMQLYLLPGFGAVSLRNFTNSEKAVPVML